MNPPFTSEQLAAAKARITEGGQAVTEWARSQGLNYGIVNHTLAGRTKGLRGEAFRVAVALGLRQVAGKKTARAKRQGPRA